MSQCLLAPQRENAEKGNTHHVTNVVIIIVFTNAPVYLQVHLIFQTYFIGNFGVRCAVCFYSFIANMLKMENIMLIFGSPSSARH